MKSHSFSCPLNVKQITANALDALSLIETIYRYSLPLNLHPRGTNKLLCVLQRHAERLLICDDALHQPQVQNIGRLTLSTFPLVTLIGSVQTLD